MDGDSEKNPILRFNVPIDPDKADDVRLYRALGRVPNGLKLATLRMALLKFLPEGEEELKTLLAEVILDQAKGSKKRGRRAKNVDSPQSIKSVDQGADKPQEDASAGSAAAMEEVGAPARERAGGDKEVDQPVTQGSPAASTEGTVPMVSTEPESTAAKSDLSKYAGLLGQQSWN